MSGAAVADYLSSRRYLAVATVRKDGRPHAALSAFLFSGERFWLPTTAGTARERNVRRSGYVSLVIAEGDGGDHRAVLSEGPAEVVPAVAAPVLEEWSQRHGEVPEWADSWIAVTPVKLFSYDAGLPEHLVGWRCETCGDTFTAHGGEEPNCPSCGSPSASVATEPFL